ncbi:MAG: GTP-binding protein [Gemmatimonadaceae bacterium]|nr:GTP-binding protein [Gemmatimonadaceae bacterium]NUQ91805.1 GTP-binding protein [Gemmatimonadaceae bacterium]NUR19063.1 GTP-binding protein [Gemmatimonadaceae bacterium]NUS97402.1 GTP-binding protein [Gemmatimonadaceae bacterium]
MHLRLLTFLLPVALACGSRDAVVARPDSVRADSAPSPARVAVRDTVVHPDSLRIPRAPLVARPEAVRGLYVNRWAALGGRMWELVDLAKRTEVNALVIDVKDDRGLVLYRSRVPLAREIGADTTQPMRHERLRAVLDTMRAHGIYPIARIVVVKDPLLASKKLEWSIKRRDEPTAPWLDKNGNPWLDAHQPGVWSYAADLADEAVDLGFSEVQFDYVRFPDEKRLVREATFPLANGRVRAQVIRDQLGMVRCRVAAAGVPMTIDVFGLTATDTTDMGIGQRWEMFIDQADIVLPMTYPSHFAPGSYGIGNPNAHPYEVLAHALGDAKRRTAGIAGAARIVPWYQDFTLGPPRYGAEQVRAQIKAGYDAGFREWLLWNPGSRYTVDALRADEGS